MKSKKINLKTLENVLSEKELKSVVGGDQRSSGCGNSMCVTNEHCPNDCPECKMDEGKKHKVCMPRVE